MLKKSLFLLLSYIFIQTSALAAFDLTTISLDVGKDEQNNSNSLLSVDTELSDSKRLFFGLGKSKLPSGSETIESNLAFIGISEKQSDNLKLTGTLESSGLKGAYTMLSAGAGIQYSQNDYFVEFAPAVRRINLTTLSNKQVLTSSVAIGFKAGLFLGDNFRLSGSSYSYTYSRDVSKLASFASMRFFDVKTLLLSSGLLIKSNNFEAGLDFESFSISIGKNISVSAIDNTTTNYVYTSFDYYINNTWGISILAGEYLNTPADSNNYSSLTVNYTF